MSERLFGYAHIGKNLNFSSNPMGLLMGYGTFNGGFGFLLVSL